MIADLIFDTKTLYSVELPDTRRKRSDLLTPATHSLVPVRTGVHQPRL